MVSREQIRAYVKKYRDQPINKEQRRLYKLRNQEKIKKQNLELYYKNKEAWLERQRKRRATPEFKEKANIYQRDYRRRKRAELFALLGNKCTSCGNTDIRVIQIDHKSGQGSQEVKFLHGYDGDRLKNIVYYLKKPELAKEMLQCLCANCNIIKKLENHEIKHYNPEY